MRVTVEQPLRLKWAITEETVDALRSHKTFRKLGQDKKGEARGAGAERQKALTETFESLISDTRYDSFNDLWKAIRERLEERGVAADSVMKKLVETVTGVRDARSEEHTSELQS